jgi:transposase-like protein
MARSSTSLGQGQTLPQDKKRKYNDVVHAAIVQAVRDGNYRGTAARLVGINETTLRDWLRPAEEWRAAGLTEENAPKPEYLRLLADIEEAEADFEAAMVSRVTAAANSGMPNTWPAAMTILERKMPEKFGKRDALKISGDAENPLQVETRHVIDTEDSRSLGRDFLRSIAVPRTGITGGDGIRDESAADAGDVIEGEATEVPD